MNLLILTLPAIFSRRYCVSQIPIQFLSGATSTEKRNRKAFKDDVKVWSYQFKIEVNI